MKIIELLNKIANGEEVPEKIKIQTHIFTKYNYSMGDGTSVSSYESNNDGLYYINEFIYPQYLNNEIEIIEEKKIPEKIPEEIIVGKKQPTHRIKKIEKKINEIINYLDYLKSKGE